ncbi:Protein-lysine methyltransferase METTL21C [Collichthys lucidus]|uniref:Protein-lysine methyltransferase METTL21C n=1 Tax=Collichthys lucidus TaxID=240159 RepID=A0A4U5U917_COLLU|nr:Protein-lysine methyltransferase METTL21C [Collichthys lucidus]
MATWSSCLVKEEEEEEEEEEETEDEEDAEDEEEKKEEDEEEEEAKMDDDDDVTEEPHMLETEREDKEEEQSKSDEKKKTEEIMVVKDDEKEKEEKNNSSESSTSTRIQNITVKVAADSSAITLQQGRAPIWVPSTNTGFGKDVYHFVGHDISIYETIDSFGAVMWPAALALCSFLDNNRQRVNLQGKEVLELGAGLGLVTIVASLLGASVTATDLPNVLSNLRANVMRNTRGYCRHMPQVAALSWGYDLERTYPTSAYQYDYVMAADVVYHHDFLDELLATMKHFCRPGTTLIWANKVRFETDLTFTENFKNAFNTQLLAEDGEMKIFMATCRE